MVRVSSRLPTSARPAATSTGPLARVGLQALAAVVAGFVAMGVTAGLGLWAAGAADLPGGFTAVLAAVVVMAAGGKIELSGDAGALAGTQAELTAMPLTVTLVGALVTGFCFLRPLRHHAVAGTRELLLRAVSTVVLWLLALAGVSAVARHDFPLTIGGGDEQGSLMDIFGELLDAVNPTVGFRTDVGPTLFYGLLWILGVLVVALLVSRRTPLPARLVRYHEPVRPAAHAMLLLLLAYVAIGLVIGVVVAATKGHAAETLAVLLLGLPNVSWLALGVGIGGSWEGRVDGPFGLPMPQILDAVMRQGDGTGDSTDLSTIDLNTLAAQDGRAWWLLPVAAVLVLAAAFVAAVRSPARTKLWQHALHLAIAFALTMLVVAPLTLVEARFGLSVLGIGELDSLGGEVILRPHIWKTVGFALLWGAFFGFLGGLLATRVHRKGEVEPSKGPAGKGP
ncbi:streptophobe family protein [Streptomyces zaomyceticus]|uniref:Streptophobe family protein n=1 Tax=Streptomyces zaomyceticus TaxID=68286 RepID=A0ABZ1LQN1_9ACTN|nr:streptophobe family protein [Streptomyces zaomyceticus]